MSDQDNRYYVVPDVIDLGWKEPEFDYCLYIGTLTLSLKVMNSCMSLWPWLLIKKLSPSGDWLPRVFLLYILDDHDQFAVLEKVTVTFQTYCFVTSSWMMWKVYQDSLWGPLSILTSTLVQNYASTVLGGFSLLVLNFVNNYYSTSSQLYIGE